MAKHKNKTKRLINMIASYNAMVTDGKMAYWIILTYFFSPNLKMIEI